jgi:hypothetical protein
MRKYHIIILILLSVLALQSCGSIDSAEMARPKANEKRTIDVQVTDKDIKTSKGYASGDLATDDKYLIYTDKGTFEITDSLLN